MPPRPLKQRSGPLLNFGVAVAVLAGLGTAGYVSANYLGLFDFKSVAVKPSRKGMVPVAKSLVALRAFEKVERESVYDREMGEDSYFWLPESQVRAHPEWVTRVDQVIGRVMARDKRADFVFSEKDFLPEGSRVGLSGGVPEGKQGFFLDAEQVAGLRLLKQGDRFDLMASLPEESASADAEYGLLVGGIKARGNKPIPLNGVRLLVQSGTVIALTNGRSMTTRGALEFDATDSRGRPTTQTKGEQVAVAIDPEEVVPLTQALGSKLAIHAVARSGQQQLDPSPVDPLAGMIPFPAAAVEVAAFTRITAHDLAEPLSGELRQYYFKPGAASASWIGSVGDLLGRVVRRNIDAGYIFTEDDFLPVDAVVRNVEAYARLQPSDLANPAAAAFVGRVVANDLTAGQTIADDDLLPIGTMPGIAGGIPAGRMAVSVEAGKIAGLGELSRGGRCDVMASMPFDLKKELGSGVQMAGGYVGSISGKAVNTVLAVNALVIDRRDDKITLAVHPAEVANLTKSLALQTPMFSIAKSSNVDSPAAVPPPDLTHWRSGGLASAQTASAQTTLSELNSDEDPMASVAITEVIVGKSRQRSAYRRSLPGE